MGYLYTRDPRHRRGVCVSIARSTAGAPRSFLFGCSLGPKVRPNTSLGQAVTLSINCDSAMLVSMTAAGNIRQNNHYVPRFLLNNFSLPGDASKLLEYRLLVEHPSIPQWKARPIKKTARHKNLYTVADDISESDALETWLDEKFENPVAPSVQKVLAGHSLDADDLRLLSRFFAAQFVRIPAWYIRHKEAWARQLDDEIQKIKQRIERERPNLNLAHNCTEIIAAPDGFPLRMVVQLLGDKYRMTAQSVTGRKMWMWSVRHVLRADGPVSKLQSYQWSILEAPAGIDWILSDNPAVSCVSRPNGIRNHSAPLDTLGAHLMLPLSPKHLLYHRVGYPMKEQYTVARPFLAQQLRANLIEAAYRSIYGRSEDLEITAYRPRIVSAERAKYEREEWIRFGAEQTRAERFETLRHTRRLKNNRVSGRGSVAVNGRICHDKALASSKQ